MHEYTQDESKIGKNLRGEGHRQKMQRKRIYGSTLIGHRPKIIPKRVYGSTL